ncbi:O-antigen ligase family protein [Planobacterium oryzisoli]|uniref:O-antigen ligase family protein n=1 Tax=Planobacterium oryzisoli TaxID=2771435 RepID=A0A930YV55_9FLAO|nr:O-antigen ligase family protein [Planobacterium oryzisoli]MBF5026935.1 O-antigen ligase family protein [Planobacterium oryzisoli]
MATFYGAVAFPMLSVFFIDFKTVKLNIVLKSVYIIYFIFCFINILFYEIPAVPTRSSGISGLWPISFGQAGTTLSLLSLYMFGLNLSVMDKILHIIGYILGVTIVFISGSKGPVISLAIISLFYLLYNKKIILKRNNVIYIALGVFIGTSIIYLFYINTNSLVLINRINYVNLISDPSTIQRLNILKATILNIYKNPFFGSSFLITEHGLTSSYPHFLILEAFMTTGIFGGVLFLTINIVILRSAYILMPFKEYHWIILVFLQYFLQTFVSSSLYASTFFWIFSAMLITISFQKKLID